ncbi:MAG: DNA/RNA non-specific endonuclease [Erythrobacter sp.]|uniref:DNA/RNA non-specific endonuclease n=1 Tax=Erythrobacter sp. TaxID=1042 RepID=UPI001B2E31FC|nr:DNA/RNA non-specific endonuclease [Erythrobacter sp.]MBO6766924.1 DNA/RNA non-specific endonuclease [Erythrobacter sp.]
MDDPFQMQRELRYGAPVCDQVMTGRHFTIGYSWYFRQAKWTLEIINRDRRLINEIELEDRLDNFRADTRVPKRFRAGLNAYRGSGFDRGHLVSSANQDLENIQNSETFLLSNMSPQHPGFNRRKWRELEQEIRRLDAREDVLETYVLTCPIFYFGETVETIGADQENFGIDVPVPHAFMKSVLAETISGRLKLWTFEMKNERLEGDLGDYLVKTYDAEQIVGGRFWDRVAGGDMHEAKGGEGKIEAMWPADPTARFIGLR